MKFLKEYIIFLFLFICDIITLRDFEKENLYEESLN